MALESGIFELAAAQLSALGSRANWVSLSRGKAGRAGRVMQSLVNVVRCFGGQATRPDLAACVSSRLFEISVEAVAAFGAAGVDGVDGLGDTDHQDVQCSLALLRSCRAEPTCEAKIRSVAPALTFCLENSLDVMEELGYTTQSSAALGVCCGVFGRDDGGSEFTFTQQHIDILLTRWTQIVRAVGYNKTQKPTAQTASWRSSSVSQMRISRCCSAIQTLSPTYLPEVCRCRPLGPERSGASRAG